MIVYRHRSLLTPPDLDGWQPRDDAAALCSQRTDEHQYVGIADPPLWQIPAGVKWAPLADGWEVVRVKTGGVDPARDLCRLDSFAPPMLVSDAVENQWLAPVILTTEGARAFSVRYAGADFLPVLTETQTRAEAIAREARGALTRAVETGEGIPQSAACRWAAFMLSISSHLSPETIAATGILDDVLVRRVLIAASGLDRRSDGDGA